MRLDDDLKVGATELTLAGSPSRRWWLPNDGSRDQIIVATTDYLPGHSEVLTVTQVQGSKVTFTPATRWFHSGTRYAIATKITNATAQQNLINARMDPNLINNGAETRAAVVLLTRSIRIVSEGDKAMKHSRRRRQGHSARTRKRMGAAPASEILSRRSAGRRGTGDDRPCLHDRGGN